MKTFSERNGTKRTFENKQLWDVIRQELREWRTYRLFIYSLGGSIVVHSPTTDDPTNELHIGFESKLQDPDLYFRRELVHPMGFELRYGAGEFFRDLPYELTSSVGMNLNLVFDFLEVIYPLASLIQIDSKTKKARSDSSLGKKLFRDAINPDLALAEKSYTMLENGQIVEASDQSVIDLSNEALTFEGEEVVGAATMAPIKAAVNAYLKRGASLEDKKHAVRSLADALEPVRAEVKLNLLKEDEAALFETANKFAIRHNKDKQRSDYDKAIWYDWMYHVNLAAILTVIKIIKAQKLK